MDAFDYAMKMEKDGEQYYRELAQKSPDKGMARILTMLADQEVKHFDILRIMKSGADAQIEEGTIREDVKNIFEKLRESASSFDYTKPQVDLYKKAQGLEQESRDFYLAQAEKAPSPAAKEIFLKIADEEKAHYEMLDTMIEFVSRPQAGNWLENAEWYHTDAY